MNLKLHQKRKTKNHNTIVMETSSKRKKKSQRRKLLPQRLDQDTSISHGLRPTTKREAHMQSTKLSKKSKMKFWASRKKASKLTSFQLVFFTERVRLSSTLILRRHGSKTQSDFHMSVMVTTSFQPFMWQISLESSRKSLKLNQRETTFLLSITTRNQLRRSWSTPSRTALVLDS